MEDATSMSRQIFLTALTGGRPERVPVFDFMCSQNLIEYLTGHHPPTYEIPWVMEATFRLGLDAAFIPFGGFKGYTARIIEEKGDTYTDEWGTTYKRLGTSWPVDAPVAYPIRDRQDFLRRKFPDPTEANRLDPIRTALALAAKQIAVLGGINGPLTIAFTLTGWDTLIYSLFDDQQLVRDIFRVATDFDLEAIRRMAQAGVDAICLAEDLAFNTGTFFSPVQYREFLFPFLAEIVAEAHRYNLPVLMHCDGQINAVLDDLVQMGIDGLNPVERKAGMDIAALKHKYAQRLCLVGNVDATRTLTHGTPNDVRREVLQLLDGVAREGAYILCSDSDYRNEMPNENILTMVETAKSYGRYPICIPPVESSV